MGGRSSGVELQPSKLAVASSNLVARSTPNLLGPGTPLLGTPLLFEKQWVNATDETTKGAGI